MTNSKICIFQLDESDSLGLHTISRHLSQIPNSDDTVQLNVTFSLSSLIDGVDLDKFYTYKGNFRINMVE